MRLVCHCGHDWREHDGYAYGPNVREWCKGAGYRNVYDPNGELMDRFEVCVCREYTGPDPRGEGP